ncbi:tail length tape measure protein [Aeromonas jandaei]|uniref:phage tail tape measure protein n=1 Tax=Aeromonas jandaei TaxID=650 RepID=UPI000CE243E5|nr:phage tail tape measure protein [Aeromonas jandaei]PPA30468.1 tail length tape measure protein [Aeromonas jandaei]
MAGNFKVGMTLTAKDDSSAVLVKGLKLTTKAAQDAQKAIEKSGNAQQKSNEQSAKGARSAAEEARRLAMARENLGVRAEKAIQREIDQTIASYNRLTRSGVASAREQDRAFRAMKDRVRELKTEMNGVSRLNKLMTGGRQALAVGGGIVAGGAVLAQPVARQMAYERSLSAMANTAFSDGGQAGRLAGREKLAGSIRGAVTYGGGTKEDASEAMNEMLASGAVNYETANKWLPDLMKLATASGASAADLAKIAVKGKQFGLTDEQIPTALNMAIAAGKTGNVELKDLARYLPNQLALARQNGMTGLDDFSKLLALNEASGITAGNSDEAGNNVINLLAKLNSREAADSAARIKVNGKGIDLPGSLAIAREKGVDPIEAFNRIVDKVVGGDKRYQQLKAQMASAKDDGERKAIMASMATLLEGSAVGQIVADRQALMALLAYRNNPAYRKQVEASVNAQRTLPEGQRAGDEDFNFIASTNDFKLEQAKNTADFAQMDSVKRLADVAGSAADAVNQLGQEFPGMTTAVAGATTAITAMTAAATAFAGLKFLTGGAAGVGAGSAAAAGGATAAATAAEGATVLKVLGRMFGVATLATSLSTMTTPEEDAASNGSEARWKAIRDKYPQSVIDAAREKYQPWYQFGEGYSTENEQWIRQYLADEQGVKGADVSPSQVMPGGGPSNWAGTAPGQAGPSAWAAQPPLNVTTQFVLDGHVIAEAVNQYNVQDGNRGTGGVN